MRGERASESAIRQVSSRENLDVCYPMSQNRDMGHPASVEFGINLKQLDPDDPPPKAQ